MVVFSRSQRSLLSLVLAALLILPGAASAATFNVNGSLRPADPSDVIRNAYTPSEVTYTGTITFDTSVLGVQDADRFTFADAVTFDFSLSNGLMINTLSPIDLVADQSDPTEFEIGVRGGVPGEVSANGPTSFMVDDFSTPPVTRTFELVSIFFEADDAVTISGTPTLGDIDVAILLVSELFLFFEPTNGGFVTVNSGTITNAGFGGDITSASVAIPLPATLPLLLGALVLGTAALRRRA